MSNSILTIDEINVRNIFCDNDINFDGKVVGQGDISTQHGDIICYRGNFACINGDIHCGSGSITSNIMYAYDYQNLSDHRLKENVEPLSEEYSIDGLKPCVYEFISDEKKRKHTGFIAHEVQEVLPHLVSGDKDAEEMQSVNYVEIIAILTKEVQNLKSEMAELKSEMAELKS